MKRREAVETVVYSIRLDRDESRALERRARLMNLKPSVLARNLIRAGLNTRPDQTLSDAVEQLETAVEQLRAIVP